MSVVWDGLPEGEIHFYVKEGGSLAYRDPNGTETVIGGSGVRSGAGVPAGAPTTGELSIAIDTETGFVYLWNGEAWLETVTRV